MYEFKELNVGDKHDCLYEDIEPVMTKGYFLFKTIGPVENSTNKAREVYYVCDKTKIVGKFKDEIKQVEFFLKLTKQK